MRSRWRSPDSRAWAACSDERVVMIATLAGRLRRKLEDRVILECGGIGYEVFLPPIAFRQIEHITAGPGEKGSELELVVYYHATRDQPRPVLIGFTSELDKEFFEKLITVKDIGPMVAARALALPVAELADALARAGAAAEPVDVAPGALDADGLRELVWEIMVKQLGHRPSEASQLITDALRRRPSIMSPEELFDEIYRGEKK